MLAKRKLLVSDGIPIRLIECIPDQWSRAETIQESSDFMVLDKNKGGDAVSGQT
jgi:hypothetical protein